MNTATILFENFRSMYCLIQECDPTLMWFYLLPFNDTHKRMDFRNKREMLKNNHQRKKKQNKSYEILCFSYRDENYDSRSIVTDSTWWISVPFDRNSRYNWENAYFKCNDILAVNSVWVSFEDEIDRF